MYYIIHKKAFIVGKKSVRSSRIFESLVRFSKWKTFNIIVLLIFFLDISDMYVIILYYQFALHKKNTLGYLASSSFEKKVHLQI